MNILWLVLLLLIATGTVYANKQVVNKVIYIDPGHGGIDGGAVASDGTYEKDINLIISFKLKERLENAGFYVIMTRYGDYDLASTDSKNRKKEDMQKRVDKINKSDCDIYISIHANAFPSNKIRGAQTLYKNTEENKTLAALIQNSIKSTLRNTKRDISAEKDLFILDNTNKVGCLVEVGFISNTEELINLKNTNYQDKLCEAIFIGIIEYFQ